MMMPAIITPREMAMVVFLKPKLRMLAARVPVQAPVPGKGIATNRRRAIKAP